MARRNRMWPRRALAVTIGAAAVLTPLVAPTPASAASLCAPPADIVPPLVTDVTLSRSAVDLNSGSRTVTVTAHATDASGHGTASGVQEVDAFVGGYRDGALTKLRRASGTAADGVWTGSFTIPKTARPGAWTLEEVDAQDAAGNSQFYGSDTRNDSPTSIALQPGWDTTVTVTGTPLPPPPTAPAGKLRDFAVTPQAVDTTMAAKTVHFTATFSRPEPSHVSLSLTTPSGQGLGDQRGRLSHVSGDRWAGHLTIPRWAGHLTLQTQMFVNYPAGVKPRYRSFSFAQLQSRHFPATLAVTSKTDRTRPVLTALSFSPSSVNTVSGAQTLTVTAKASDTQSGVASVHASIYINDGASGSAAGLYPYPGLGYDQSEFREVTLKLVGSTWVGTTRFPECVPSGSYHVGVDLQDKADNFASYSPKKLIAAGLPGSISVTATPGDVEPPEVRDATASGLDQTITLDFTEGVKTVDTSTLSVFAEKPAATRFQHPTTVTGITCSNGKAIVDCSGSGGLVTSAVLAVPAVTGGAEFQVYANLNGATTQLTDGAGNPLGWQYDAADVTGS